ncbi:MAG: hypothetical protein Q8M26_14615 [Pseudolabrys sp.]|nr:hypothetical protein [Pseudolabrys sp.]
MWVNVGCTLIETTGLLLVIAVGVPYWGSVDLLATPSGAGGNDVLLVLVFQAAVLTFLHSSASRIFSTWQRSAAIHNARSRSR